MKLSLAALFLLTAALYASVGFGGGSTYTALLVLFETDYRLIPIIALSCNILVVSGNCWRYGREGLIPWRRIVPLIALSVPAAWLGGRLAISEFVFIGLLWVALLLSGLRLIFARPVAETDAPPADLPLWASLGLGGGIGFYAGLVGIGGGIFLAPVLHMMRWGRARVIAAACSLFILVNSAAGIVGQVGKLSDLSLISEAVPYWPLLPAVLIGGFVGNYLGVFRLSDMWVKRLTGGLILAVALRLAWRWFGLI